jgi:hypothetical protein
MTGLGKIMGVASLVEWIGEIYRTSDVPGFPQKTDYQFGTLVKVPLASDWSDYLVGVTTDVIIHNPELVPGIKPAKLSTLHKLYPNDDDELHVFTPIFCLGQVTNGVPNHRFPMVPPDINIEFEIMTSDEIHDFHVTPATASPGVLTIGYFSRLQDQENSYHLFLVIAGILRPLFPAEGVLLDKLVADFEFQTLQRAGGVNA